MTKYFNNDIDEENLKLAELIKNSSEQIDIPKHKSFNEILEESKKNTHKPNWKKISKITALAACFIAVVSLGGFSLIHQFIPKKIETPESFVENEVNTDATLRTASSYDEVYDVLEKSFLEQENQRRINYSDALVDIAEESYMDSSSTSNQTGKSASPESKGIESIDGASLDQNDSTYSKTNVQTENIDEEDIVKTNGKYIFTLHRNSTSNSYESSANKLITISKAEGTSTKTIAKITMLNIASDQPIGMFQYDDKISVICRRGSEQYRYKYYSDDIGSDYYTTSYDTSTVIYTYDISKINKPILASINIQDGAYVSSRLKDNYLYTVTNKELTDFKRIPDNMEIYLPKLNGNEILCDRIYIPENITATGFTIVTSLDLKNSSDFNSSESIMGNSDQIYASVDNIYIINNATKYIDIDRSASPLKNSSRKDSDGFYDDYIYDYLEKKYPNIKESDISRKKEKKYAKQLSVLNLVKYNYQNGKLDFVAETEISGYATDNLFFDEKDGYLRFVAENYEKYTFGYEYNYYGKDDNVLYSCYNSVDWDSSQNDSTSKVVVLDESLNTVATIDNLAKNEEIYSARYLGDYGYFVTFEQTDPLFTIDFTDIRNPKIASALEMPGFSDYLHFYSDKLLFGLGEETVHHSTKVKLEMYDISEKKAKQKSKLLIGDESETDYSSPSLSNYKALLIDPKKNLIGFSLSEYHFAYYAYQEEYETNHYLLYQYTNNDFQCIVDIKLDSSIFDLSDIRGFYIDHYFYVVVPDNGIYAVDLDTYEQTSKVEYEKF